MTMSAPAERANAILFATGTSLLIVAVYTVLMGTGWLLLPEASLAVLILAQLGGLLLPTLVAIRMARWRGFLEAPTACIPARRWLAPCLVVMLFGLVASLLAALLWLRIIEPIGGSALAALERETAETYARLFSTGSTWGAAQVIVAVSLLPALCEEALFRGLLQRGLAKALPQSVAIAGSSLFFSLAHLDPFGFPSRVLLGVSLGLVLARTGTLLATGFVHALHNTLSVLLLYAGGLKVDPEQLFADPLSAALGAFAVPVLVLGLAVALGGWLLALRWLKRCTGPPPLLPRTESSE